MAELPLEVRITLETTRCYTCGRWWALERGFVGTCPKCAQDAISLAREAEAKAGRSAAATRGALARAKGRLR